MSKKPEFPEVKAEIVEELPEPSLFMGIYNTPIEMMAGYKSFWRNTIPSETKEEAMGYLNNEQGINKFIVEIKIPAAAVLEDKNE